MGAPLWGTAARGQLRPGRAGQRRLLGSGQDAWPCQACPRVRDGKAVIRSERCIDCGECIRQCPYQAKRAMYDKLEKFKDYKYKIALPAPALYGQFDKVEDIDYIISGN